MTSRLLTRRRAEIGEALAELEDNALATLQNRAYTTASPTVHTPSADTITAVGGMLLTVKGSGLFQVCFNMEFAAAAADVVTFTISTYRNTVAGTAMTLPTNATATGVNSYYDNSGAGIAPTAGATAVQTYAFTETIGTAAVDTTFSFANLCVGIQQSGYQFYTTISVTDSAAARGIPQLAMSMFELP
jgi:hypothetical protein